MKGAVLIGYCDAFGFGKEMVKRHVIGCVIIHAAGGNQTRIQAIKILRTTSASKPNVSIPKTGNFPRSKDQIEDAPWVHKNERYLSSY